MPATTPALNGVTVAELAGLIEAASEAHHTYETTELGGERDEAWPLWYADYIVRTYELTRQLDAALDRPREVAPAAWGVR